LISGRLGLDHDRVLAGRYALPVMCCYLEQAGGKLVDKRAQDRLLYWYVHSFMWGRYAGSTETVLNQDLAALNAGAASYEQLVRQLRLIRGDLAVRAEDFGGWSVGARFYPVLYLLTRIFGAQDWGTGLSLNAHMLGKGSKLQIHHIYPKAQLYKANHERRDVNAAANFCFLTAVTDQALGDELAESYFPKVEKCHPGALASQWIPLDPTLWRMERYADFLAARRELLADAADTFLNGLLTPSTVAATGHEATIIEFGGPVGLDAGEAELPAEVQSLLTWLTDQGIAAPSIEVEVASASGGEAIAVADVAWPGGVQPGLTEPVALVLDGTPHEVSALSASGYRVFTSVDDLRLYLGLYVLRPEGARAAVQLAKAVERH